MVTRECTLIKLFGEHKESFDTDEVVCILQNIPTELVSNLPPVKPKGGQMHIYQNSDSAKAS